MDTYNILVETLLKNLALGRPGKIWEDDIKMNPKEIGCDDGRWMKLNSMKWYSGPFFSCGGNVTMGYGLLVGRNELALDLGIHLQP